MNKLFILLAACTFGFASNVEAANNEAIASCQIADIDEETATEVCELIVEYIENIKDERGDSLNSYINDLATTLDEFDTEYYELFITFMYVTIEEKIPGRGFTMDRFNDLYDEIALWKNKIENEDNLTDSFLEKWQAGFFAYCDTLPYDEKCYALLLVNRYLEDLLEAR